MICIYLTEMCIFVKKAAMKHLQREITPIGDEDLFIVMNHPHAKFDYAGHFHSEYEINLVINGRGERIVGDCIEEFEGTDLVMIGPNVPHRWTTGDGSAVMHVVTIQFPKETLDYRILCKKIFHPIRQLCNDAFRGIVFSEPARRQLQAKILDLTGKQGFDSAMAFFGILHTMAQAEGRRFLLDDNFEANTAIRESKSRRINQVISYIQEHFAEEITLAAMADTVGMSESAFSHFFKRKTNRSFIDYLNDIRIGHASKLLYETTHTVSEVCYASGFNNISNFNRIFKRKKGSTPSEYRNSIQSIMTRY